MKEEKDKGKDKEIPDREHFEREKERYLRERRAARRAMHRFFLIAIAATLLLLILAAALGL